MSVQITVRLPDHLVAFADREVQAGHATSRADIVAVALDRERRRRAAERDAAIYAKLAGADPDGLDGVASYAARRPIDLD
ncbi:MAG TPA: ribbon-helix-helix domain-containing protein [Pilimelia sp.]|nr:ribbon-helix-helix domain-containing protein [Pilimelia sp.]